MRVIDLVAEEVQNVKSDLSGDGWLDRPQFCRRLAPDRVGSCGRVLKNLQLIHSRFVLSAGPDLHVDATDLGIACRPGYGGGDGEAGEGTIGVVRRGDVFPPVVGLRGTRSGKEQEEGDQGNEVLQEVATDRVSRLIGR